MDGSEKSCTEDTGYSHHVEGVQCPVVKALEEENEPEDTSHSEAWSEEPSALSQWVQQEH